MPNNTRRRLLTGMRHLGLGVLSLGLHLAGPGIVWAETEILEPSDTPVNAPVSPPQSVPVLPMAQPGAMSDTLSAISDSAKLDSLASPSAPAIIADSSTVNEPTVSPSPFVVGDQVVEVDQSLGRNADKNLGLALLATAVLPGTGEWYLRSPEQGRGFMIAEAGFWAALLMSFWAQDSYLQSARNQASEFAGIDASGKSVGFLNTMAEYRSYREKEHRNDSYELSQILSGKRNGQYDIAATPENDWDFGSSNTPQNTKNWKTFQSTLRYYRASKVAFTFAVGGLALNRVVALAHTLRLYRRTAMQGLSSERLRVIPEFGPAYAGGRLILAF